MCTLYNRVSLGRREGGMKGMTILHCIAPYASSTRPPSSVVPYAMPPTLTTCCLSTTSTSRSTSTSTSNWQATCRVMIRTSSTPESSGDAAQTACCACSSGAWSYSLHYKHKRSDRPINHRFPFYPSLFPQQMIDKGEKEKREKELAARLARGPNLIPSPPPPPTLWLFGRFPPPPPPPPCR